MSDDRSSLVPKLARKARLRFDRHANGHLLVYPERGLALNASAAAIVERCDGTRTAGAIAEELAAAAGVETSVVLTDVLALVDGLAKKGLLEP